MSKVSARAALSVVAAVLLTAAVSSAQTVQLGTDTSITFKGFLDATFFGQNQAFTFGNGQNAEFPVPPQTSTDRWFYGGDVRNTRLTMVFNGPKIAGDWKVNGTLETDFFGGTNGTGAFAEQQEIYRLRLAFIDVTNGSTTVRFGQQWAPLFANTAVSLSHIAFPLGYGAAGDVGWRFPGIFVYQNLTPKGAPISADLQFAVMQNSWSLPAGAVDNNNDGNAGTPQFELRANVGGKAGDMSWSAYAVGHYDQKDLSGAGASAPHDKLTSSAVEIGAKFQLAGLLIQGNGYTGHGMGNNFGALTQFGRIQSTGGWAQVGYDFTKNWGLFAFWGEETPKKGDVLASGNTRIKNEMYSGLLRWRSGPFSLGLEWLHDKLTTGAAEVITKADQVALSAKYDF